MTMRNASSAAGGGCLWIILNGLFLIFLGIGGYYGYGSWQLVQAGGSVTGTVVDVLVSTDSDNNDTYAPRIEYAVEGDRYSMVGIYTSPRAYDVGDKVKLRYDRSDPSSARIDSFVDLWLLPIIFLSVALLFGVIYNLLVLFGWLRRRR